MTLALPSRRPTPAWVRNDLWRRARAVPSLDLRFADNKSLVDAVSGQNLITFTRASDGTFVNSAGVLQTAAAGVPRFDHSPVTGECLGLLVEEQRVNSLANNTAQGAVAGAPGTVPTGWTVTTDVNGISREIVGVGTEDGINYIDIKYSGTTTASGQLSILPTTATAITASSGQSWTASAYVKLQAGSLNGLTNTLLSVNGRSSVGAGLESTNTTFTPSSAALRLQRQTASITLANASTARISMTAFAANYANGVIIDATLRIGMSQLEQGAFATSVIPTSGSAATRNADVVSITGTAFSSWFNAAGGTGYTEFRSSLTASGQFLYSFNDGTSSNRISAFATSAQFGAARNNNAAGVLFTPATANAPNANLNRQALAFANLDYALSGNGGSTATASEYNVPNVSKLDIGNQLLGGSTNGTIRRLTYWPTRLPNATLQSITQ